MYWYSSIAPLLLLSETDVIEMLDLGATGVITTGATVCTGATATATAGAGAGSSADAAAGPLRVRNAHVPMTSTMAVPHSTTSRRFVFRTLTNSSVFIA